MRNNRFMTIVHYNGQIVRTDVGVVFQSESPTKMIFDKDITLQQLKEDIKMKIEAEIDGLRYRWITCHNPVIYSAIPLVDDSDVGIMIVEHESTDIGNIELYAEVRDVPYPSRNVVGNLAQMGFSNDFDMPGGSFVAMLESGTSSAFPGPSTSSAFHPFPGPSTSSAFHPFHGSSTYATSYEPMNNQFLESIVEPTVGDDVENLRGRWGETLEDSSEDEDIGDPDLFPDDIGDAPNFGAGEFVSSGNDITWYEPPTHMDLIDFDAMRVANFSDMPQLNSTQSNEFSVGIQFDEKNEATLAVKEYSIKKHADYVVVESSPKTFFAKCMKYGEGCNWKIRVSKIQRKNAWVVTKYSGSHTCLRTSINQDHHKLDSNVISHHVMKLVEANPRVHVSVIQATVAQLFGYQIKYIKGWRARDKAMKSVYGDYDKSYNELPTLLQAMTFFIPSTIVRYLRMHGTMKVNLYKGVNISIDYSGRSSHALKVFHFANETAEAWSFFLSNLREHVVQEDGVCIISDRGKVILSAINRRGSRWTPPEAYPAYCVRHIVPARTPTTDLGVREGGRVVIREQEDSPLREEQPKGATDERVEGGQLGQVAPVQLASQGRVVAAKSSLLAATNVVVHVMDSASPSSSRTTKGRVMPSSIRGTTSKMIMKKTRAPPIPKNMAPKQRKKEGQTASHPTLEAGLSNLMKDLEQAALLEVSRLGSSPPQGVGDGDHVVWEHNSVFEQVPTSDMQF
ncbi:hypothetical protein GQ457_14G001610 [Hibiscus cannabinus]